MTTLASPVVRAAYALHMRYKALFDEPELRLLARLCPRDRTFLDVGANQGIYSWVAAHHRRPVIAIEPHPAVAGGLARVLGHRIDVRIMALSDRAGTVCLRVPVIDGRPLTTRATLDPGGHGAAQHVVFEVPSRRLDDLELPRLGLVKIDVEGHEAAVLAGAVRTLARDRPALLVEIEERHAPGATRAVPASLATAGYRGGFLHDGALRPIDEFRPEVHQRLEHAKVPGGRRRGVYINNFVFVHQEDPAGAALFR